MLPNLTKQAHNSIDRRVEHLLLSTQLEESGTNKFIIFSIALICATVFILVIWAALSELEEITIADGVIAPNASVRNIQHLEGGIISDIYYKNGDVVQKDDVVIRLAPEPATSDLKNLKSRQNSNAINMARLDAFISNKDITYDYLKSKLRYPDVDDPTAINSLIAYSLAFLNQQIMSFHNERDILLSQIHKIEQSLKSYDQQIELLESRISITENQNKIYTALDGAQNISKITLMDSEASLKEKRGQLLELKRSRLEASNSLIETQERMDNLSIDLKAKSLDELTKLTADSIENDTAIQKASDRVARLMVRAPAYGVISNLDLKVGSVIPPGQPMFELVPLEGGLVGEIKILNKDIGHVALENNVKIKVNAFDFSVYGKINGTLNKISAYTTLEPGSKDPYYKSKVMLEKDYVGNNPKANKILPGMTISAEIITDKKSILNYMLKPIKKSLSNAMRER